MMPHKTLVGRSMFIDINAAKNKAMDLTSRYLNILVRMEKNLVAVLIPSFTSTSDKERMRQIRRTMLKEFYNFIVSDQKDEFDDRCAALDAVLTHLECATQIDPSKVTAEIWSTPGIIVKEAQILLEDLQVLNKMN